ncbi:MAG: hypothetical protein ACRBCJ_01435 [Hyphomicrobiaceae bacterium]
MSLKTKLASFAIVSAMFALPAITPAQAGVFAPGTAQAGKANVAPSAAEHVHSRRYKRWRRRHLKRRHYRRYRRSNRYYRHRHYRRRYYPRYYYPRYYRYPYGSYGRRYYRGRGIHLHLSF